MGNSSQRSDGSLIRKKLRPYQAESVRLWEESLSNGFGFFHEQRVGKSLPALKCVTLTPATRLLIVCLKKGISVWQKEIRESLPPDWKVEVEIINYSQLLNKSRHNKRRRWLAGAPSFMIVDEAHHIKRRGSRWSKRCRSLGRKAKWRLALTGTVIAQGIQDAWAVFDYMDPKIFGKWQITKRVGPKTFVVIGGFQPRYLIMDYKWKSKIVGYQNEEEFMEIFHRHCDRQTLREVKKAAGDRPHITRRGTIFGELYAASRKHYDELEQKLITVVNQKRIETPLVITLTMKLQQICGGYLIDEDGVVQDLGTYEKLKLLSQALDRVPRERVVVVCRFIHEIEAIRALLRRRGYGTQTIKGGVDFDASQKITAKAIILQIQSGVSIDLSIAKVMIFYSWDYSHINHQQSLFRVLSYHSTRVTYYYLVMKRTIDELILQAVRKKGSFSALVCDHYRKEIKR